MDAIPLNSPSLNTLLRTAGLKSDFLAQKNFNEQNFHSSFSDKLSEVASEKYEPGETNNRQPESSYISLMQPQFQSNSPISKNENVKNSFFEKSTAVTNNSSLPGINFNKRDLTPAQIFSSSSETIGTGYYVSVPSGKPDIFDLVHEEKHVNSKFKIYFDQTKLKGTLVNVML